MKITPTAANTGGGGHNLYNNHAHNQSSSSSWGRNSVISKMSNMRPSDEPLAFTSLAGTTSFLTGRGCCIDMICSIKSIIIMFLLLSVFITCIVIWIIMMILISSHVEITMEIASIVVWCTFVVAAVLFSIMASIGVLYMIRKPIRELTRQIYTMKTLRFDSIKKLSSILFEFIPLYVVFHDLNNLMKDIRPFIPESITRQSEDDLLDIETERKEEERRQMQMMELRKKLAATAKKAVQIQQQQKQQAKQQHQQQEQTRVITVKKSKSRADLHTTPTTTGSTPSHQDETTTPNDSQHLSTLTPTASITPRQKTTSTTTAPSTLLSPNDADDRPGSSSKFRNAVMAMAKPKKPLIEGNISLRVSINLHDNLSEIGSIFTQGREFGSSPMGGGHSQFSSHLGLGLTSRITTIIIIQFRNFDGKSYPNGGDLLSVFTLLFQKVQSASRQYRGRCAIVTPKVLMISFEVGKNVERNALLCALQLEKQMQSVNTQLSEQVGLPHVEFGIGVSRSECLVGNIGTAAVRHAALIGACSSNALRLAALCAYFGTSILTDESLTLALQIGFVTRAVHFMQKNSILDGEKMCLDEDEVDKQVIYQLLGERKIMDDEWFYEIQQQEENNKYKEYDQAFELLRGEVDMDLLKEICGVFENYSNKNPKDKVVSLLSAQLSKYLQLDPRDVEETIREFSLEMTDIPLHTDPSFIL